jgi:hypothetical protein
MKNYLAVFMGTQAKLDAFRALDERERTKREEAGIKAWNEWANTHAASIVEMGAPLGKTKRTASEGVSDIRNNLAAYTVVRAESHDAAAKLFLEHPHFTLFPGDAVEIMECLPIPSATKK